MTHVFPSVAEGAVYPAQFVIEWVLLTGETVIVRPAKPEDIPLISQYIGTMSDEDRYNRYLSTFSVDYLQRPGRLEKIYRATLDYLNHMAFVVIMPDGKVVGVCHAFHEAHGTFEVSYSRSSDRKGSGIGTVLMQSIIAWGSATGVKRFTAITRKENKRMQDLFLRFGFSLKQSWEDGSLMDCTLDFPEH